MIPKKKPSPRKRKAALRAKAERAGWRAAKGKWPERDKERRDWCHTQPCFASAVMGELVIGRSECCHVGELRGLGQKCSDFESIPMTRKYHILQHKLGGDFWAWLGVSREYAIAQTNEAYEKYLKEKRNG